MPAARTSKFLFMYRFAKLLTLTASGLPTVLDQELVPGHRIRHAPALSTSTANVKECDNRIDLGEIVFDFGIVLPPSFQSPINLSAIFNIPLEASVEAKEAPWSGRAAISILSRCTGERDSVDKPSALQKALDTLLAHKFV